MDSIKGLIWVPLNLIPDFFNGVIQFMGSPRIGASNRYIKYFLGFNIDKVDSETYHLLQTQLFDLIVSDLGL